MPRADAASLRDLTAASGLSPSRFVADAEGRLGADALVSGAAVTPPPEGFAGKSVLIACDKQRAFLRAALQLDGVAARLVICPADVAPEHLPAIIATARVDAIIVDGGGPAARLSSLPIPAYRVADGSIEAVAPAIPVATEWVLLTSGTSGPPKLVVHSLASLIGPLSDGPMVNNWAANEPAVWSTFYDVRRYGGLQILLRALVGGGSLVLSQAGESAAAFLDRAAAAGITHISGTPSHWRRALMSAATDRIAPRYVRLSGEIADQAILDRLAATYPRAAIAHAFASTEAGLAFTVDDGQAGFPADFIGRQGAAAELRLVDGSLRIRSTRTAARYLGGRALRDAEGFVDSGDMIELRDGRCHFAGRREGVINVGGQKVHPEEVEAVIGRLPGVRMVRVRAQRSPITGALVAADIVKQPATDETELKGGIMAACRAALPAHKVPALLRFVSSLDIAASGKLARHA